MHPPTTARRDDLPLVLQKTFRRGFYECLQIVRCFDTFPGSPTTAAYLSLLFQKLQIQSSLSHLHISLAAYIESFIAQHPRNQTDLSGKVLAAAIYLNISDLNKLPCEFPERRLIDYIEYAAEQSWLQDSFLAYYCSYLEDSVTVCQGARAYFTDNFELFLNRRSISAVSQALIVLGETLAVPERVRGYKHLYTVTTGDNSIRHSSWALTALANDRSSIVDLASRRRLVEHLERHLSEYSTQLVQKAGMPSLLALIWSKTDLTDIQQYFEHVAVHEETQVYTVDCIDPSHLRLDIDLANLGGELTSVADVAVALIALAVAGEHRIVGVVEAEEGRLETALIHAQRLQEAGLVPISRKENTLLGGIALITVFSAGAAICLFFLEANVAIQWDFSKVSWRNWNVWVFAVFWIDYMLAMVQAIASGESVAKGMTQLPLIRHSGPLKHKTSRSIERLLRGREHAK